MNRATILVLDDDEAALMALTMILRPDGYRVLSATTIAEAKHLVQQHDIAVVIADQRLPDGTGTAFLGDVRKMSPDTIRIVLTGYPDVNSAVSSINDGHVYRFFSKPWDDDELRLAVQDSVHSYQLRRENRRLYDLTVSQSVQLRSLNTELEQQNLNSHEQIERITIELEENLLDVIRLLSNVQELRSKAIAGHALRVSKGSLWIARKLRVEKRACRDIEIAAMLHDIGKLALDDEIIHKETYRLSRQEKELHRQIPILGESILATIPALQGAAKIVRHQGEWFNGNGFPDRLRGADIPIGSRIIAVMDAYEETRQLHVLQEDNGRRFDPQVIDYLRAYLESRGTNHASNIELTLDPDDLIEGMVLTRDIYTEHGLMLATRGVMVDDTIIDQIRNFDQVSPLRGKIHARR